MNRYNELKLKVLSLFAATQSEWLGPNEAAEKLISHRQGQPGRTSKGSGALVCWKGVPEDEEPSNIVLMNQEDGVFVGYARSRLAVPSDRTVLEQLVW